MLKTNTQYQLNGLGMESHLEEETELFNFVKQTVYLQEEPEDYINCRIEMYQKQKKRSSQLILPDPDSLCQHLKRSNYQSYIWNQCTRRVIDYSYEHISDIGWAMTEDDHVRPLWYQGPRFPDEMLRPSTQESPGPGPSASGADPDIDSDESCNNLSGSDTDLSGDESESDENSGSSESESDSDASN